MKSFVGTLCRKHPWAADLTSFEELPRGWSALVEQLFEEVAAVMADRPGGRLGVLQAKEKMGALRIRLQPIGMSEVPDAVRALVAAAERRSTEVCDTCGEPGSLWCDAGWSATRCDLHAALGSVTAWDDVASPPVGEATSDQVPAARAYPAVGTGGGWAERTSRTRQDDADALRAGSIALYDLDDVAAALGRKRGDATEFDDGFEGEPEKCEPPPSRPAENEHDAPLHQILAAGDRGRWRDLAGVAPGASEALDDLGGRAPHFDVVTAMVRRHLRASLEIGLPVALPPLLLLGEPGVGKTWFLSRLAGVLGVPFRTYPMNVSTLGEGLSGSHPSWRASGPGLVAKTLLRERLANPLVFVDEVDKAQANGWNRDPYAPLYSLLDRSNSQKFSDEFLQFPIDASAILWVLAGNTADPIPEPIMDRLTVFTVPPMHPSHLAAVCRSIYAESNAARRGYFDPEPHQSVVGRLLDLNPRSIRVVLDDAMVTAAASGRRTLAPDDLRPRGRRTAYRVGFRS